MVYPKCQPLIKASLNHEISEGGSWQQGHVTRPSLLLSLCSRHQEVPVQDPGIGSRTHVCLPGGDDEIDSPNLFSEVSYVS